MTKSLITVKKGETFIAVLLQLVDWGCDMNPINIIKDRRIPREEVSSLLWSMGSDISTHSLSMWIKSKTKDEFVVVPRYFILEYIEFLETERNLNNLKVYL